MFYDIVILSEAKDLCRETLAPPLKLWRHAVGYRLRVTALDIMSWQ